MFMETSLRAGQVQSLTAQVIQSIKVLHYGQQELSDYLAEQAERNPLLEVTFPLVPPSPPPALGSRGAGATGGMRSSSAELPDIAQTQAAEVTLRAHLQAQAGMSCRSAKMRAIAAEIIDSLEPDGYLRRPLAEIARRLGCAEAEVAEGLALVQSFEPVGVGARDLAECLRLQLEDQGALSPQLGQLLAELPLLAAGDLPQLARRCGVSLAGLQQLVARLRQLNPAPGHIFDCRPLPVALPDVLLVPGPEGAFSVELNADVLPKVLVDRRYHAEIRSKAQSGEERRFITECYRNASWLVRILDQRAQTMLRVASEIVRHQHGFFLHGVEHLRPLSLKVIAQALNLHESTISRAVAQKSILTPRGQFPLKFFFSDALGSSAGGEAIASEMVRQKVRSLIAQERPEAVLSDDAIALILRGEGIDVARRTIAKYRIALKIPSSSVRRRQLQLKQAAQRERAVPVPARRASGAAAGSGCGSVSGSAAAPLAAL